MPEVTHPSMTNNPESRKNMCTKIHKTIQNTPLTKKLLDNILFVTNNLGGCWKMVFYWKPSSPFPVTSSETEPCNKAAIKAWWSYKNVVRQLGHVAEKFNKDSLKDGVARSCSLVKDMDEKFCVRSRAKAFDDRYHISKGTTGVVARIVVKGKKVFADARRQDPTGFLSSVEQSIVDMWYTVFGFSSYELRKVEGFSAEVVSGEEAAKSTRLQGKIKKNQ